MNLVHPDHPILRAKAIAYPAVKFQLLHEMATLMLKSKGIGLAAPQVGFQERVFLTAWGDTGISVFHNPNPTAVSPETAVMDEGCLSLPGIVVAVPRPVWIELDGRRYTGMKARVIQHELDHLNGKLITDYL